MPSGALITHRWERLTVGILSCGFLTCTQRMPSACCSSLSMQSHLGTTLSKARVTQFTSMAIMLRLYCNCCHKGTAGHLGTPYGQLCFPIWQNPQPSRRRSASAGTIKLSTAAHMSTACNSGMKARHDAFSHSVTPLSLLNAAIQGAAS